MKLENLSDEDDGFFEEPGAGDAIELLTADHEDVKMLFTDYEELVADGASAAQRAHLAEQICSALIAHSTVEEEIFYPAAREAIDQPELLDQAETDHGSVKALIVQIQDMDPEDPEFDATVMQLQESVDQHVHEEEGEIFPRLLGGEIDLESLGDLIMQRKNEVLDELEQSD